MFLVRRKGGSVNSQRDMELGMDNSLVAHGCAFFTQMNNYELCDVYFFVGEFSEFGIHESNRPRLNLRCHVLLH